MHAEGDLARQVGVEVVKVDGLARVHAGIGALGGFQGQEAALAEDDLVLEGGRNTKNKNKKCRRAS